MYEGCLLRIISADANRGGSILDNTIGRLFPLEYMQERFVCFVDKNAKHDPARLYDLRYGDAFVVCVPVKKGAWDYFIRVPDKQDYVITKLRFREMEKIPEHAWGMVVP